MEKGIDSWLWSVTRLWLYNGLARCRWWSIEVEKARLGGIDTFQPCFIFNRSTSLQVGGERSLGKLDR